MAETSFFSIDQAFWSWLMKRPGMVVFFIACRHAYFCRVARLQALYCYFIVKLRVLN